MSPAKGLLVTGEKCVSRPGHHAEPEKAERKEVETKLVQRMHEAERKRQPGERVVRHQRNWGPKARRSHDAGNRVTLGWQEPSRHEGVIIDRDDALIRKGGDGVDGHAQPE